MNPNFPTQRQQNLPQWVQRTITNNSQQGFYRGTQSQNINNRQNTDQSNTSADKSLQYLSASYQNVQNQIQYNNNKKSGKASKNIKISKKNEENIKSVLESYPEVNIDSLLFHTISEGVAKEQSSTTITSPAQLSILNSNTLQRTGTIYDLKMGPCYVEDSQCQTCGNDFKNCLGHWGMIHLRSSIIHPKMWQSVMEILRSVCTNCGSLIISDAYLIQLGLLDENGKVTGPLGQERLKKIADNSKKIGTCVNCESYNVNPKPKGSKNPNMVTMSDDTSLMGDDIKSIFNDISNKDSEILGFKPGYSKPSDLIIDYVLVLPNTIRSLTLINGELSENHINKIYRDIITFNNGIDMSASLPQIQNNTSRLAEKINNLFELINDELKSKYGLLRGQSQGKVVSNCARTVISPDPSLKYDEIRLPLRIAKQLMVPITVNNYNIKLCQKLLEEGKVIYLQLGSSREGFKKGINYDVRNLQKSYHNSKLKKVLKDVPYIEKKIATEKTLETQIIAYKLEEFASRASIAYDRKSKLSVFKYRKESFSTSRPYDKINIQSLVNDIRTEFNSIFGKIGLNSTHLSQLQLKFYNNFLKYQSEFQIKVNKLIEGIQGYSNSIYTAVPMEIHHLVILLNFMIQLRYKEAQRIVEAQELSENSSLRTSGKSLQNKIEDVLQGKWGSEYLIPNDLVGLVQYFQDTDTEILTIDLTSIIRVNDLQKYLSIESGTMSRYYKSIIESYPSTDLTYDQRYLFYRYQRFLSENKIDITSKEMTIVPTIQLQPRDIIYRMIIDGDYCYVNRQPSLDQNSFHAFRAKVSKSDYWTIGIPIASAGQFNADFDGDEMNIHIPNNQMARYEMQTIGSIHSRIISTQDSTPNIGLAYDNILAANAISQDSVWIESFIFDNYLTTYLHFRWGSWARQLGTDEYDLFLQTVDEVLKSKEIDLFPTFVYGGVHYKVSYEDYKNIHKYPDYHFTVFESGGSRKLIRPRNIQVPGKIAFSVSMPPDLYYSKGDVKVDRGILYQGHLGKPTIADKSGSIPHELYKRVGLDSMGDFINKGGWLLNTFLSDVYEVSLGFNDLSIGKSIITHWQAFDNLIKVIVYLKRPDLEAAINESIQNDSLEPFNNLKDFERKYFETAFNRNNPNNIHPETFNRINRHEDYATRTFEALKLIESSVVNGGLLLFNKIVNGIWNEEVIDNFVRSEDQEGYETKKFLTVLSRYITIITQVSELEPKIINSKYFDKELDAKLLEKGRELLIDFQSVFQTINSIKGSIIDEVQMLEEKFRNQELTYEEKEELIIDKIENNRGKIQQQIMKYLPDSNRLKRIAKSGAKGDDFNIQQLLGLLGQQIIHNARIDTTMPGGNRNTPFFPPGTTDPRDRGLVTHSFSEGLTPVEMLSHQAGAREGILYSAVKTALVGNLRRHIFQNLQDIATYQDGTVRMKGSEDIIQFASGTDNIKSDHAIKNSKTGIYSFTNPQSIVNNISQNKKLKRLQNQYQ